jgi:hypothetical protein
MKALSGFITTVVMVFAVTAVAFAAETRISEKEVRIAIESFLQNPTVPSEEAKTIVTFAAESDAVNVVMGPVSCPWIGNKEHEDAQPLLLAAFAAGNVRSQLDSGVRKDDAYSGLIAVFRVYRHMKNANPKLTIPEVEKLLKLHRQGRLTEHLAKEKASAATKPE